jgi:uncharacterized membrane protein YukC
MKPKFKTQFNSEYQGVFDEQPTGDSKTLPDQTLSIQQLLINHTRGIPSNVSQREGEYFDTEIPRHDDIIDAKEYAESLQERKKELEEQAKIDEKEISAIKAKEKKEKEAEELKKAQELVEKNKSKKQDQDKKE